MKKEAVRNEAFRFLGLFGEKIKTKFTNICAKTGRYDVPEELFQKRTSRKNRVLIPWKVVRDNCLTIEQLETFRGGVAVDFVNEDFFDEGNWNNSIFQSLSRKIGSDDNVSAIISIKSESGSSSSAIQRHCFKQLLDNSEIIYKNQKVIVNQTNYKDFFIKQTQSGGVGNEKWSGFLFVSIKGGQQDTIESHKNSLTIFNPAVEFAAKDVCLDIDLVMAYFALHSIQESDLSKDSSLVDSYNGIMLNIKTILKQTYYNNKEYQGDLLSYCDNHPSLRMFRGKLYDPIQIEQINILDFSITEKEDPKNIDFTHNEAVNLARFYWDNEKKCILSPARPTNVFWSKHLSNMMQQNFSLKDYFKHQEEIVKRRSMLLSDAQIF